MEIREARQDGVLVLGLSGRLDGESARPLHTRLQALLDEGERRFVVDAAGLTYVSSSGMKLLLAAVRRLEPAGGRIVLCALQAPVRRVLEIAGLTSLFAICASAEEAVKCCLGDGAGN
jgi:anti-sigma B factor antagonist